MSKPTRVFFQLSMAVVALAMGHTAIGMTVATNASNQIVYTVDEGVTNTVSAAWPTDVAGIVKEGLGTLAIGVTNANFTKPVFVNAGVLSTKCDNGFGADVVTVADGAAVHYGLTGCGQGISYNTKCKDVRIAGTGPDGRGAVVFVGSGSGDMMLPLITLTADAMVGGNIRWGFVKCDLQQKTLTVNAPSSYMMFNGNSFVNPGHVRATRVTYQGGVTMNGGSANTLTLNGASGCQLNYWGSTKHQYWTLNVVSNAEMRSGGSYSNSRNQNWWDGPVNISEGRTLTVTSYDNTDNCVQFEGVVSGGGAIRKLSENGLYFDAANDGTPNTYTGGTTLEGGTTYFNRSAALACYDQVGKFAVKGSATASFYCQTGRWSAEQIQTAVNNSTNFAETGHVEYNVPSGLTFVQDAEHGFNKPVTITARAGGKLVWQAPFSDDVPARIHGRESTMVFETGGHAPCTYFQNDGGTVRLEGGTDLDMGSGRDANISGNSKTIVSNACWRTLLTDSGATSALYVNGTGTPGATLEILDGAVISNKIHVGTSNNTRGAVYQRGGFVRHYARGANDGWCGSGNAKTYGYYELSGGTLHVGGWFGIGHNSAGGVMNISGGLYKCGDTPVARGGYGRLYMSGGSIEATSNIIVGEQQWGGGENLGDCWVTVTGTGTLMKTTSSLMLCERTNNYVSVVNLNGGVVSAQSVYEPQFAATDKGYTAAMRAASAKSFLNCNGGTFRAHADHATVFGSASTKLDRITVYEKGLVVDTNGKTITNLHTPLRAPSGRGVKSITYTGTKTGYIGSPEVHISGGGGEGATAYVAFDSKTGTIGDVEVTSAGWDYTSAPTVWFYTPGRTTAITCTVALTEGDLPSGGLVKIGAGEFKFGSQSTFTGDTVVSNGTFTLMDHLALPEGNTLKLAGSGVALAVWTNNVTLAGFGGAGRIQKTSSNASLPGTLTVTDKLHFDGALLASGASLNATAIDVAAGPDVTIEVSNTNALETTGRAYTLMSVNANSAFTRDFALANLERPWMVVRTDGGTKLKLVYSIGTVLTFR